MAERMFNVTLSLLTAKSIEEGKKDVDLILEIVERDSIQPGFYTNRSSYWGVPDSDVTDLKEHAAEAVDGLVTIGIITTGGKNDPDCLEYNWDGVSWDDMMSIEQAGLELLDQLGDKGFDHAKKKDFHVPKAERVKKARKEGKLKKEKKQKEK